VTNGIRVDAFFSHPVSLRKCELNKIHNPVGQAGIHYPLIPSLKLKEVVHSIILCVHAAPDFDKTIGADVPYESRQRNAIAIASLLDMLPSPTFIIIPSQLCFF